METFLKNKSFEVGFTLTYKDTGNAVDLDTLDAITVIIKNSHSQTILVTETLAGGGVTKVTSASGILSIFINSADTLSANSGQYDYEITIELTNTYFDDNTADFVGFGVAFMLE